MAAFTSGNTDGKADKTPGPGSSRRQPRGGGSAGQAGAPGKMGRMTGGSVGY